MSEVIHSRPLEHEPIRPLEVVKDLAIAGGATAFFIALSDFGFSRAIKDLIFARQGGLSPEGKPIDEYHHIVPENALKRQGIRGKNVADNGVGLSFGEHKHKWDLLMLKGIFFPGVPLDQIDPDTYTRYEPRRQKHRHGRKHR